MTPADVRGEISGASAFGPAARLTDRTLQVVANVDPLNDQQGADTITGTDGSDIILGAPLLITKANIDTFDF